MNETITRINGNGKEYTVDLPKLVILGDMNDTAINHILENTGLYFKKDNWGNLKAQPHNSNQIATLIMTYNFKTRYYNNASTKNTIFLKSDHHVGFDVDSICYDCCKENRINTNGLSHDSRLSC